MAAKAILVLCAQAILIQFALSQCVNRVANGAPMGSLGPPNRGWDGLGYDGLGWNRGLVGAGPLDFTSACGGALPVSSSSCMAPTGLTVVSENIFEGTLSVIGELPFIGVVALEGTLPSAGAGSINYGCGNGVTAVVSEGVGPAVGSPFVGGIPPGWLGYGCGDLY